MWSWRRRGTSARRKVAQLLNHDPSCESFEIHLLPHPPMQDSEVANVCGQKPNLSCKVYSRKHAFKMEFGWMARNQVRSGRTLNEKTYTIISLWYEGSWYWTSSHLLGEKCHTHLKKDPWKVNRKLSILHSIGTPNSGPRDPEMNPDCKG